MTLFLLPSVALAAPNVLVIIADDMGVDKLADYEADVSGYSPANGTDQPVTPAIDLLVDSGVRFTQAWANPLCSPTRATILTGNAGYRTGIGFVIGSPSLTPELATSETTLPEALGYASPDPYTSGMFGKWHLGETGGDADSDNLYDDNWDITGPRDLVPPPNLHGFIMYAGRPVGGGLPDYWSWKRTKAINYGMNLVPDEYSVVSVINGYATTDTANEASTFMQNADEPWLAVVAFNAPHADNSGYDAAHAAEGCSTITSASTDRESYRAMAECVDFHIDAMLTDLKNNSLLDDTVIFFVADNGTPHDVGDTNFPRYADGKGSLYESGIRIPLIVAEGKHVAGTPYGTTYTGTASFNSVTDLVHVNQTCDELVHTVDIYDTILELAGVSPSGADSVSFADQLYDPTAAGKATNYSESFKDPDSDGIFSGTATLRDATWKIIVTQEDDGTLTPCQKTELYDLVNDRAEATNEAPFEPTIRASMRSQLDAVISAHGAHWMWPIADTPRLTGACP